MQHLKNNKHIYFAIALYVTWIIVFSAFNYYQDKKQIYSTLDQQLESAALTIPLLLPNNFHNKAITKDGLSEQQDKEITLKLSEYTHSNPVAYIYTLILQDEKIFFTSSSASDQALEKHDSLTSFFEQYDDVDPLVYQVFRSGETSFLEYTDKWGRFRSIFIPLYAEDGTVYIAGADLPINHIQALLSKNLYLTLVISVLFLLLVYPLFILLTSESRRMARKLEQRIEQRTSELVQSEAKLNSIVEHSPVGIFHYNNQGELIKTNKRFEDIIGAQKDKLIGFNMLTHLKDPEMLEAVRQSLAGNISSFDGPYTSVTGNRFMYLHGDFVPLYSSNGDIEGGVGVYDDRTDIQRNTDNLKKLSMVVEYSPNGILITDIDGTIEYINPKYSQMIGYSSVEVIGKKTNILNSGETDRTVYETLWSTILSGQEWCGELHNRKKNGELFLAQVCIVPIINDDGVITHFIGMQEDVTEVRMASKKISFQAKHDMLTGLINRYEFENRLALLVDDAQQNNATHALCFLDLDQFKIINDTCGHVAGDELLRQLSLLLQKTIQSKDILARIGGDEFAILMENCNLEQAEETANTVLELVKKFQFMWMKNSFSIGVSIGLTQISKTSGNITEVLIHADSACYAAKDLGRNRIHIYHSDDALLAKRDGEFRWVNEIKDALNENRFELYAQPIVSLSDVPHKRIYEVLLRLRTKNGDIIPPGTFFPAAERYNLSQPIDRWVVDHTFSWLKKHLPQLDDLDHLTINLSGASLGDNELLRHIMQQIKSDNLPPGKIQFEITETAAISNLRDATLFINILREFGCQFALDDFGSGLSSFAYLKNLSVSTLKIDGLFVKDILNNQIDGAMVKSINEIGHIMGMKTIAEFVENDAIKDQLTTIGVDFAQGYGIGKPEPIDNILTKTPSYQSTEAPEAPEAPEAIETAAIG
ncbi:EAL domain-containing protein [Photobacterium lipolyticum]|uniref:Bifunctional diguanylate cyclase/phosphodiesterase n=1 Tax=Photobacterium lipolyticum TaxID=266810 RepID=A0A2T3N2C7_9GAMM|nr:EAL domain-containing protein [Photobacterium lipolyticum]PSW06527.1 bifunctional diguanylate cyclase/phosphodiesterase [Photobacterium lipolyticum]